MASFHHTFVPGSSAQLTIHPFIVGDAAQVALCHGQLAIFLKDALFSAHMLINETNN